MYRAPRWDNGQNVVGGTTPANAELKESTGEVARVRSRPAIA